ncbi:hypothetical protein [Leptolyngbya sp. FACHB-261]|uniref:hypothetical protein n=1 Tax=Leptolyngbya sp. FACHB-261 TaxID=2692806 RepID=UPI001685186D|nr:hypothetical protein [Leptolyngbya sp. FACHB-261]MBD2104654.1 hypothetical protein [Leptolyngbya sp. FACHB-261]
MFQPSEGLSSTSLFELVHVALTTGLLTFELEEQINQVLASETATAMDYAALELLLDAVHDEYVCPSRLQQPTYAGFKAEATSVPAPVVAARG